MQKKYFSRFLGKYVAGENCRFGSSHTILSYKQSSLPKLTIRRSTVIITLSCYLNYSSDGFRDLIQLNSKCFAHKSVLHVKYFEVFQSVLTLHVDTEY